MFVTRAWETHLMTTLWENFSLFEPRAWLSELSKAAGLRVDHRRTRSCNWSYGFREKSSKKIADIVVGFDGMADGLGCYVIETKRPGGKLTNKDLNPGYYLDIECISRKASLRKLIYCVDFKQQQSLKSLTQAESDRFGDCGLITWETLGGIQVALARSLNAPAKSRSFVAGSIQYQFCQHGIVPAVPSEEYLAQEPSIAQVDAGLKTPYDNHDPQWVRV